MSLRWILFFFLANTLAVGQAAPTAPAQGGAVQAAPPAATVAPDAAVITLKGLCSDGTQKADCATTVTRADFENLVKMVQPQMPQQWQRQFATSYARLLVLSSEARKRGLESAPRTQAMMKLAMMNVLQQQLTQELQEEARKIPADAVERYYEANKASYARADLLRLYIPIARQPEEASAKAPATAKTVDKTAEEAAGQAFMKEQAVKLQARAAAGEDFDKLQAEAFKAAGLKGSPPPTKLTKVSRAALPGTQRAAFDLKPGEVSQLITEPNGMYVYKMLETSFEPLDSAKDEIQGTLQGERFQELLQSASQTITPALNDAFFGPEPAKPGERRILPLSPKPDAKK